MHELHVSKRKFSRSTEKARDNLRLEISSARAHQPNLCVFCEKVCPYFRDTSAHVDFFRHQILSSLTKLQRRHRLALREDNFLSDVKTERFYNLHA